MREVFNSILVFFLGCISTQMLHEHMSLPLYLTSSIVGLVGGILFYKKDFLAAVIFCGSFAGMSSPSLFYHWYNYLFVSVLGGVIAFYIQDKFKGFGGKLGSIAFISVAITIAIGKML